MRAGEGERVALRRKVLETDSIELVCVFEVLKLVVRVTVLLNDNEMDQETLFEARLTGAVGDRVKESCVIVPVLLEIGDSLFVSLLVCDFASGLRDADCEPVPVGVMLPDPFCGEIVGDGDADI